MIPFGLLFKLAAPIAIAGAIGIFGYSTGSANVQRKWDKDKAERIESAYRMSERARAADAEVYARLQEAERAKDQALRIARQRDAATGSVVDELRDTIARITADKSATCDSVRERDAATLRLLGEGSILLKEGARYVDELDAEVKRLRRQAAERVCIAQ